MAETMTAPETTTPAPLDTCPACQGKLWLETAYDYNGTAVHPFCGLTLRVADLETLVLDLTREIKRVKVDVGYHQV